MLTLADKHCFNHGLREAVARCPDCSQFYCRECITEHEDRVVCASCLKKMAVDVTVKRGRMESLLRVGHCVFGIMILWLFFFLLGQCLLAIPTSFHEGTIWNREWPWL